MSNSRTIFWLSAAVAALSACHVLMSYGGRSGETLPIRKGLVSFPPDEITAVEIALGGTNRYSIAKADEWELTSPYRAAVDRREAAKLLDALSLSRPGETMTDAELSKLGRTRDDFGLGAPRAVVKVSRGGLSERVFFGAETPGGTGVYASPEGQNWICIVPSGVYAAVARDPESFRKREFFSEGPESVLSFDVKGTGGRFMRFVRDGAAWKMTMPSETKASAEKVSRLLDALTHLQAEFFVWPTASSHEGSSPSADLLAGWGLDAENAFVLSVRFNDGSDRQLSFGKDAGDGLVYALSHLSESVAAVPSGVREMLASPVESFEERRLFPVDPAMVGAVSVVDAGVHYLVARSETGAWLLDSPVSAAADAASAQRLLANVLALTVDDVSEDGLEVSLPPFSWSAKVDPRALLADMKLDDLRSGEIFSASASPVKRISVSRPGEGVMSVVYDRDRRAWNVESSAFAKASVDEKAVAGLLAAVSPLTAEKISRLKVLPSDMKAFGLDTPRATVAIDIEGALRRNILIGSPVDGGAFATLGAADAVFVISSQTEAALTAPIVTGEAVTTKGE